MAVAVSELLDVDDPDSAWVPVARAAAHAGVTPAAVRRAANAGAVPMRKETVGRRTRSVVLLAEVVAILGPDTARVDEAIRRADDAVTRASRAEELVRFLRDELAAIHHANEELKREVTRLGQEQFRLRATNACGDDDRTERRNRRRMWGRRAPAS